MPLALATLGGKMAHQVLISITKDIIPFSTVLTAMADCNRTDLVTAFIKVEIDLASYGKDGLDLMIDNGWMEEIPLTVDRKGLKH